MNRFTLTCI